MDKDTEMSYGAQGHQHVSPLLLLHKTDELKMYVDTKTESTRSQTENRNGHVVMRSLLYEGNNLVQ